MSKSRTSSSKWFAGKRYRDGHVEIVFGQWKDVSKTFQFENHSHFRGFKTKEEAQAWVFSLPSFAFLKSPEEFQHYAQIGMD